MQTMSIHLTTFEKDDESLMYYDEFSLIIAQALKALNIDNINVVDITDFYGTDSEKNISHALSAYTYSENNLITSRVEISPIEFGDQGPCTEDMVEEIQKSLLRDQEILIKLGFKEVVTEVFDNSGIVPYIYGNDIGNKVIEFLQNLKCKEEEQNEE